jgi:hypothetical protein
VLTDQPALFQALFQASPKVAAILSDPTKAQLVRRHLRFLHVTSSFPGRNERRVLAEVKLPASAAEAEPALELVMAVVDALPGFRQTAEARKRAEDARAAANAAYEARRKQQRDEAAAGGSVGGRRRSANPEHEENQRRMMERRQQRLAEEREKAKREGKLDEWEKQQRAKEQKKMMKKRAIRI